MSTRISDGVLRFKPISYYENLMFSMCRDGSGRMSHEARSQLDKLPLYIRKELAAVKDVQGCTPLFNACKRGHLELVEYLLLECEADIEAKGIYEVPEDRSYHSVTPLWCAAVSGRLSVLKYLLDHGASINAVSDTGSTPVRSACYMTHIDIVKYLVESGADINRPNFNGGTCLINSVQSIELCKYLIHHGADVNAHDIQNKTALHYAIQERRLETTKLLLSEGADPLAMSKYGDDALQTACLKGAVDIFDLLISKINYPPERLASAHELLGTTYVDEMSNRAKGVEHWKIAHDIRTREGIPKAEPEPLAAYRRQKEYRSIGDLEALLTDTDALRINCLLVLERILTPYHKHTIFRLMFRGASYADIMRYQRCVDLWLRALDIRVKKDTILYSDTCFTAQALVRFMVDYQVRWRHTEEKDPEFSIKQSFADTLSAFQLLTLNITETRELLMMKPQHKRQVDNFEKILRCITHLIYLLLQYSITDDQMEQTTQLIKSLIRKNVRSALTGDTLLHICVSNANEIRSGYFLEEVPNMVFPNRRVIQFLLDCGADVNARNNKRSTPLHIATSMHDIQQSIVTLLLSRGAHIDQTDHKGRRPVDSIIKPYYNLKLPVMQYISLKCLSATVVAKFNLPYKGIIPKTLEYYIDIHT